MSKFIAMLPDEIVAEDVTKNLGKLQIEDLDWSIISDENRDRILPAFAWPVANSASGTGTPAAPVLIADDPESRTLESDGVEEDDAAYFGRAIEHGGTAIVIDTPDEHDEDVKNVLQEANASRIVKE